MLDEELAVAAMTLEEGDVEFPFPQIPNAVWQPEPQWSGVLPHHPAGEQHSPYVAASAQPLQVNPTAGPQVPSTDVPVGVAVGAEEAVDELVPEALVAEGFAEEEVTIFPEEARYQLAGLVSPRHSPTVTPR